MDDVLRQRAAAASKAVREALTLGTADEYVDAALLALAEYLVALERKVEQLAALASAEGAESEAGE
jgi:hypothetical protein